MRGPFLNGFHFLILASLLVGCAGVSSPSSSPLTSPSTQSDNVGVGASGMGDTPIQGNPQAAQPLQVGAPAPGADPTLDFQLTMVHKSVLPFCRLTGKDLYDFRMQGFVAKKWDFVSEDFEFVLTMGSIRVIDVLNSRYTDVPLSSKQVVTDKGVITQQQGYFEFQIWSPLHYQFRFYLIPPKLTKPNPTPWTDCPAEGCVPEPEARVLLDTVSGDLEGPPPDLDPVPFCQVGGGTNAFPVEKAK